MSATELRARLAEIDTEITQLQRRWTELHETRVSVQAQLDSVLIYPVLTLPVEIVAEIFVHCLPTPAIARPVAAQAPLVLLHICRRWREIALSTSKLWAALDIDVGSRKWRTVATRWLNRARGCPLSVILRHPPDQDVDPDKVLAFIKTFRRQLRSLQVLGVEQLEEPESDSDFGDVSFPLLEQFVCSPSAVENDLYEIWLAFFGDAPRLRQLALLGAVEVSTPLPWHQLTVFTGYNFSLRECLDILRLAQDLLHCTFSVRFYHETAATEPPKPVTHPRLQFLGLLPESDEDSTDTWVDILKFLTLPALQSLQFTQIADADARIFEEFLVRSSAPLRHLALSFEAGSDFPRWEPSFRLVPDLQDLHMSCSESPLKMQFFKVFSVKEEGLLPQLHALTFHQAPSRFHEMAAAVTERKKEHEDDKLSSAVMLWSPEDLALRSDVQFVYQKL